MKRKTSKPMSKTTLAVIGMNLIAIGMLSGVILVERVLPPNIHVECQIPVPLITHTSAMDRIKNYIKGAL